LSVEKVDDIIDDEVCTMAIFKHKDLIINSMSGQDYFQIYIDIIA